MKTLNLIVVLILISVLNFNCSWNDNVLGQDQSPATDPSENQTPTTSFSISIEKGSSSGPCLAQQEDFTILDSICFDILFERAPVNFSPSHIILTQPGLNAQVTLTATGNPLQFAARITNYSLNGSEDGIYSLSINAGVLSDSFGNQNLASTSNDNTVEVTQYKLRPAPTVSVTSGSLAQDSCQGLDLQIWETSTVTSLNSFFSGSPGVAPNGVVKSGVVSNLLNTNHLAQRTRTDNYVMRWKGFVEITTAGAYQFRTRSDAGSRLYINGILIVNNDGVHTAVTVTSSTVILFSGLHSIELQYFETTAGEEINTTYSGPDTSNVFISPRSEIFQPETCPHLTSIDNTMISSFWTGVSPYTSGLVGIVRDDVNKKHIKLGIDNADFLKITSGNSLNGTVPLTANSTKVLAAHNNAGLTISSNVGATTVGAPWSRISRIWRLECTAGTDFVTFQIPTTSIDSAVNGILFSSATTFNSNFRAYPIEVFGSQKAITFKCSDLSSSTQFFTFGRYNL